MNTGNGTITYLCNAPQIAVRGDGAVIITEATNAGFPSVSMSGQMYPIPPSTVTNGFGTTIDVLCCVGPPMVNTDGTAYLEYEVRNVVGEVVTADTLYLMQINPDNSSSSTVLSSTTQNETQYPGNIIPDGQGGVLATWSVSPLKGAVLQYPYQAVDVVAGVVGTPYNLPFSPQSVNIAQQPSLVLGENGVAFAKGQTTATVNGLPTTVDEIISFNLGYVPPNLGPGVPPTPNWTYQATQGSTLSIIAAESGNGLAAKTTDQNGNDTVILFSSTGTAATDSWSGTQVAYYIGTLWTGTASNTAIQAYSAPPVEFSSSSWFQPQGGGEGNKGAIPGLNVTGFLTTGANQTTILSVYQKILAALPFYTACNGWAQGSGDFKGISGTSFIQTMIQNTLFGHGSFDALHLNTSAITGTLGATGIPAGIITAVNDNSAFFNATTTNSQGQVLTFEVGPRAYTGGTLKAQAFILLHELGHGITIAGFQHDNGIPKAGKANDKMVDQNCRSLIEGIR